MRHAVVAMILSSFLIAANGSLSVLADREDDAPPIGSAAISTGNTELGVHATKTHHGTDNNASPFYVSDTRPPPDPLKEFKSCMTDWDSYNRCFRARKESEEVEEEPSIPAITLTALAEFAPAPVTATGEPNNLGVAGMPTNFVAAASVHTRSGTLFDIPVTVRFTPIGYDFRYGDGDTTSTTTGGHTWSALGQADFTPTATSHIYRERGTYQASVSVRYTAEVDLGIGWFPVDGQLSIDGPTQEIRIFEAHTALVARTCVEQPTAPGC